MLIASLKGLLFLPQGAPLPAWLQQVVVPSGTDDSGLYPISVLDPDSALVVRGVHYMDAFIQRLEARAGTCWATLSRPCGDSPRAAAVLCLGGCTTHQMPRSAHAQQQLSAPQCVAANSLNRAPRAQHHTHGHTHSRGSLHSQQGGLWPT